MSSFETDDAPELVDVVVEGALPAAQLVDAPGEPICVLVGLLRLLDRLPKLLALRFQFRERRVLGFEVEFEVVEGGAGVADPLERFLHLLFLRPALLDAGVELVELLADRFELRLGLFQFLDLLAAVCFEVGEVAFEAVKLLDLGLQLVALALALPDLSVDRVGVDRAHDDLAEVVAACHRPACLVVL